MGENLRSRSGEISLKVFAGGKTIFYFLAKKIVSIYGHRLSGICQRRSGCGWLGGAIFRFAGSRIGRVTIFREKFWPLQ